MAPDDFALMALSSWRCALGAGFLRYWRPALWFCATCADGCSAPTPWRSVKMPTTHHHDMSQPSIRLQIVSLVPSSIFVKFEKFDVLHAAR